MKRTWDILMGRDRKSGDMICLSVCLMGLIAFIVLAIQKFWGG